MSLALVHEGDSEHRTVAKKGEMQVVRWRDVLHKDMGEAQILTYEEVRGREMKGPRMKTGVVRGRKGWCR